MATAEYFPSVEHASKFWKEQSSKKSSAPRVPDRFPEQLTSPLAWTRAEIESERSKWTLHLDEGDIKAIEAALASFEGRCNGKYDHWIPNQYWHVLLSSIFSSITNLGWDFRPTELACTAFERHFRPMLPRNWLQHYPRARSDSIFSRAECCHFCRDCRTYRSSTRFSRSWLSESPLLIHPKTYNFQWFSNHWWSGHVVNAAGNHAEGKTRSPGFTNGPLVRSFLTRDSDGSIPYPGDLGIKPAAYYPWA